MQNSTTLLNRIKASIKTKRKIYSGSLILVFTNNASSEVILEVEATDSDDAKRIFEMISVEKLNRQFILIDKIHYSTDKVLGWTLQHIKEVI